MHKKRLFSDRAQITIFMILGLLILFIAVFVIMLTVNVKKSELSGQQEKVLTQIFKKEALRIYVEDCLKDNLEEGLTLLGKQGRLWNDQPGGSEVFVSGNTGIDYNGERVYYGITQKMYSPENQGAYPCKNESNTPEFCQYIYPQKADFGQLKLKKELIFQKDLKNFLINRTIWCVENFTKSNISSEAEVLSTTLDLTLDAQDEGLNVLAEYPLKIRLGKEELFQLTKFDFFYPTKFKQVLDVAMLFPLQWDQQYVDFNYSEEMLKSDTFEFGSLNDTKENCVFNDTYYLCHRKTRKDKYAELGINLTHETVQGDEVYTIIVPAQQVLQDTSGTFTFTIARQNRPPALDYIHRDECIAQGYDYLVIPGNEIVGDINITLNAHDADEEGIKYGFESIAPYIKKDNANVLDYSGQKLPLGFFNLTAYAQDDYGLKDTQIVRVLVDQPLKTSFSLTGNYINSSGQDYYYKGKDSDGKDIYFVSAEDPLYLSIYVPNSSYAIPSAELSYSVNNSVRFKTNISSGSSTLRFPGFYLDTPTNYYIYNFDNLEKDLAGNHTYFQEITTKGNLKLSSARTYCKNDVKNTSQEATIVVRQCVPYVNPTHPYPVIPGLGLYRWNNVTQKEEDTNPFLATHSCCNTNWMLKPKGEDCYVNPKLGCYGKYNSKYKGYILEEQYYDCNGERGNICGKDGPKYRLYNNELRCGMGKDQCVSPTPFSSACGDKLAFSIIPYGIIQAPAWCHGTSGCSEICVSGSKPIVAISGTYEFNTKYEFYKIAQQLNATSDLELGLQCGCTSTTTGKLCDTNFDGVFEGICEDQGGVYVCASSGGKGG